MTTKIIYSCTIRFKRAKSRSWKTVYKGDLIKELHKNYSSLILPPITLRKDDVMKVKMAVKIPQVIPHEFE